MMPSEPKPMTAETRERLQYLIENPSINHTHVDGKTVGIVAAAAMLLAEVERLGKEKEELSKLLSTYGNHLCRCRSTSGESLVWVCRCGWSEARAKHVTGNREIDEDGVPIFSVRQLATEVQALLAEMQEESAT